MHCCFTTDNLEAIKTNLTAVMEKLELQTDTITTMEALEYGGG